MLTARSSAGLTASGDSALAMSSLAAEGIFSIKVPEEESAGLLCWV